MQSVNQDKVKTGQLKTSLCPASLSLCSLTCNELRIRIKNGFLIVMMESDIAVVGGNVLLNTPLAKV